MRNTRVWPAAFLGLLLWSGRCWSQEPNSDEANAKKARALLEQGVKLYRARDFAAAAPLFLEAARLGNADAQLQIGWHYEFGKGVPLDMAEAVRWYTRSARQGNAIAQRNLGNLYEAGNGVPEDWIESARWRKLSAMQKNPADLSNLARAYLYGIGVPQNRARAIELYDQAAARGDKKAAYWAKHHRDPTNVSFRNDEERRLFGLLPTVVPNDPVGKAFRNAAERFAYLRGQRQSGEDMSAQFLYMRRLQVYQNEKREYDEGKRTFPPVKPLPPPGVAP